jgi:hypothetical protein
MKDMEEHCGGKEAEGAERSGVAYRNGVLTPAGIFIRNPIRHW